VPTVDVQLWRIMQPLDPLVDYGITERSWLDIEDVQLELLPDKVHELRQKLNQKAKAEPKFRFYALYDRVCRKDVLEAAFKHVGKRGKAAGIDGVRAEDILDEEGGRQRFLDEIHEELLSKTYRASPVKRVFIPKADGTLRPLGIPTLKDRVVQMAVLLILEPIFEADFLDCSHGFRPGRKAHDALERIRTELQNGRTQVYDADLKGYFDSIPHDRLMACLRMRVVDGSVLKLIRMWLKAPIIETDEKRKQQPPKKNVSGTPQGGVISPLLANVYLHWLDVMFHRNTGPGVWANARLVRYADDFVILARYQGHRIDEWVKQTLEGWMGLKLNQEKTKTVRVEKGEALDFLGYSFQRHRDLYGRDKSYLNVTPSKKSLKRARQTVKEKTGAKKCFKPAIEVVKDLNRYLQGWGNYFSYGYDRKAKRDLSHYTRGRMIQHLNRRSQRKYAKPEGMSHYEHLEQMGLVRL
jgi:RNA-directed DNA polymerase